jgi:MerR family redox-sensitive transcriptional activator SoxR
MHRTASTALEVKGRVKRAAHPGVEGHMGSGSTAGTLSIGEVATRAGIEPSAIRHYESEGLIPTPRRAGGKRRYDVDILEWLSFIALAKEAGFTVAEIRTLVTDFTPGSRPAARGAALAARKLAELDARVARAERMRKLLRIALDCRCFRLEDCTALLAANAGPLHGRGPCVMPSIRREPANRAPSRGARERCGCQDASESRRAREDHGDARLHRLESRRERRLRAQVLRKRTASDDAANGLGHELVSGDGSDGGRGFGQLGGEGDGHWDLRLVLNG